MVPQRSLYKHKISLMRDIEEKNRKTPLLFITEHTHTQKGVILRGKFSLLLMFFMILL